MWRAAGLLALLCVPPGAAAICPVFPPTRWVGTDNHCSDNSIQAAIDNAACPGTIIAVTPELDDPSGVIANQALTIDGKSLTIFGSNSICDPGTIIGAPESAPPNPVVTLKGTSSGGSVITILHNSHVTLQALRVTGSTVALGYSGGVAFDGTGSLDIIDSMIDHNTGFAGGGIFFHGGDAGATLTLGSGTEILYNSAISDGGGIYVSGNAHLLALQPYTLIAFNHADGSGGGVAVGGPGPTYADIGSPGYNGGAAIFYNNATNGGGIAVIASADGTPQSGVQARVFTTDASNPMQISDNTATQFGGAVYVKPSWNTVAQPPGPVGASFCARDFRIEDNIASDGAAIYADSSYDGATLTGGGDVSLNPEGGCYGLGTDASLGAVACGPGTTCDTITGNVDEDVDSQPTAGATLYGNKASSIVANRFILRQNTGWRAIDVIGSYPKFNTCLVADNTAGAELIRIQDSVYATIDGCTIANNAISGGSVIWSVEKDYPDYRDTLDNSIIAQPGVPTFAYGDNSRFSTVYVLTNDSSTFQPYSATVQGAPTFVNPAAGDYRLQIGSLGIDFAPTSYNFGAPNTKLDLGGLPRVIDLSGVVDQYGPRDLGAYELAPPCYQQDTLFCNGFDVYP